MRKAIGLKIQCITFMRISNHAIIRLNERCHLKPNDIRYILENDLYHPIGLDAKKQHQHQLIYSEPDKTCFVIVQDFIDKDVVTVLPLDYHRAWRIHDDALEMAKKAVQGKNYIPPKIPELSEEAKKEINKYKKAMAKIDMISLSVNYFTATTSIRPYDNLVRVHKKTYAAQITKMTIEEFTELKFPKDIEINVDNIKKEYNDNPDFALNLNTLIKDFLVKNPVEGTVSSYSISMNKNGYTATVTPK